MRHLCTCFRYYPEEVHKIFKFGLPSNPHLCYEYPKLRVRYIISSCTGTFSLHDVIIDCYGTVLVLWDICFFPRESSQNLQTWPVAITHISAMNTPNIELGIPFHHVLGQFHYVHVIIDMRLCKRYKTFAFHPQQVHNNASQVSFQVRNFLP